MSLDTCVLQDFSLPQHLQATIPAWQTWIRTNLLDLHHDPLPETSVLDGAEMCTSWFHISEVARPRQEPQQSWSRSHTSCAQHTDTCLCSACTDLCSTHLQKGLMARTPCTPTASHFSMGPAHRCRADTVSPSLCSSTGLWQLSWLNRVMILW